MASNGETHMSTVDRILAATEDLLVSSDKVEKISIRHIAAQANVSASVINYHFSGRDNLLREVVGGIYKRFTSERQLLLQMAMDADVGDEEKRRMAIAALVGPSVRWSLNPRSSYQAFVNLGALTNGATQREGRPIGEARVKRLHPFIAAFKILCPWLSEAEIGFRIHAALGIRSNVTRDRGRMEALMGGHRIADPERIIGMMVEVILPMFSPPPQPAAEKADRDAPRPANRTETAEG